MDEDGRSIYMLYKYEKDWSKQLDNNFPLQFCFIFGPYFFFWSTTPPGGGPVWALHLHVLF